MFRRRRPTLEKLLDELKNLEAGIRNCERRGETDGDIYRDYLRLRADLREEIRLARKAIDQ